MPVHDDGLRFDSASVKAERIKEDQDYEGIRVTFLGYLEASRLPVQIDIGFGDAITPAPIETSFPTLLENPAPVLLAYPRETCRRREFEALVKLGIANTPDEGLPRPQGAISPLPIQLELNFQRQSSGRSSVEKPHCHSKRCLRL